MIFLPGLMCDATIFRDQISALPNTFAVDGYGRSSSLSEMAQTVIEQAPEVFDLFGHSMGGRVALEVYRQCPSRVRRLALSSTGVHSLKDGEPAKRYALRDIGRDNGFKALVNKWLPPMVAKANRDDVDLMTRLEAMCLRAGQATFELHVEALLARPEVASLLPAINCPTLVVTGRLDAWSPPEQHRLIASSIPKAECHVIAGSGHMLPAEAPLELNRLIQDWRRQNPETQTEKYEVEYVR